MFRFIVHHAFSKSQMLCLPQCKPWGGFIIIYWCPFCSFWYSVLPLVSFNFRRDISPRTLEWNGTPDCKRLMIIFPSKSSFFSSFYLSDAVCFGDSTFHSAALYEQLPVPKAFRILDSLLCPHLYGHVCQLLHSSL